MNQSLVTHSPPFMPINPEEREIWAILNALGYNHVKLIHYQKNVRVVFSHKPWLKSRCSSVEECEVLDLTWAFHETRQEELPMAKKVIDEMTGSD